MNDKFLSSVSSKRTSKTAKKWIEVTTVNKAIFFNLGLMSKLTASRFLNRNLIKLAMINKIKELAENICIVSFFPKVKVPVL